MSRITFLGDIMCEEPLLKASRKGAGYDFEQVFSGCRGLFSESDHVVGNLETVFAGREAGFTRSLFSFNTPDEFAEAMARSGVDIVTAATNHSLDRDVPGLMRTLEVLDKLGVEHLGAYKDRTDRDRVFIKEIGGRRVALLNYTYGTNLNESPFQLSESQSHMLNLLMPQRRVSSRAPKGIKGRISKLIYKTIPMKRLLGIKKLLGREHYNKYTDALDKSWLNEGYIDRIRRDMAAARAQADIVIAALHMGGQFNEEPGEQVRYFTRLFFEEGADYIIGNHAHVVQGCERQGSGFAAYCLGNFSISPSSIYVPHELKPEYSIALHLDIGEESRMSFSILKIVESSRHEIRVVPLDELAKDKPAAEQETLKRDAAFIYSRFTGIKTDNIDIRREYPLEV